MQALLPLDTLELEVGYGLIPLVDEEQSGNILARIRSIRRQFALDMGVVILSLHLRDNLQLKPGQYSLLIKGAIRWPARKFWSITSWPWIPAMLPTRISGIETREPALQPARSLDTGLPSARKPCLQATPWSIRNRYRHAPYRSVQNAILPTSWIARLCRGLLDTVAKHSPKAVEDLVPNTINLGGGRRFCSFWFGENVSIRDMLTIVETLDDYAGGVKNWKSWPNMCVKNCPGPLCGPIWTQPGRAAGADPQRQCRETGPGRHSTDRQRRDIPFR